ncbi:hypothetical protein L1049_004822 [Liquidambar formosana]|uniref:Uncharacterized protein n=1 Tax=Liquidambar formosana TaxID=63359 RepID=A0AAP0RTN7_LIQFO
MEARYYDRHGAKQLYSLQKFEELLHRKEMEIAKLELEIFSSRKKLSNFKNSGIESSSENKANTHSELINKISENFEGKYDHLYCITDAMTEKERGYHRDNLEESMLRGKQKLSDLRVSSSNQVTENSRVNCLKGNVGINFQEGKILLGAGEVKQISERLRILEEEGEMLKQAFFGSIEERKKLMNEIYQQFQIIHRRLRNKSTEESHDGASNVYLFEDGSMETGLSQVLHEDSNPSLVIRDLRSNMLAFQDSADAMHELLER